MKAVSGVLRQACNRSTDVPVLPGTTQLFSAAPFQQRLQQPAEIPQVPAWSSCLREQAACTPHPAMCPSLPLCMLMINTRMPPSSHASGHCWLPNSICTICLPAHAIARSLLPSADTHPMFCGCRLRPWLLQPDHAPVTLHCESLLGLCWCSWPASALQVVGPLDHDCHHHPRRVVLRSVGHPEQV